MKVSKQGKRMDMFLSVFPFLFFFSPLILGMIACVIMHILSKRHDNNPPVQVAPVRQHQLAR